MNNMHSSDQIQLSIHEDPKQTQTVSSSRPLETPSNTHFLTENISENEPQRESALENAGILSYLHFFFVVKLIRSINSLKTRVASLNDLDPLPKSHGSQTLATLFTDYYPKWKATNPKRRLRLTLSFLKLFKKAFYLQFFWQLVYGLIRVLLAYCLYRFLEIVRNPAESSNKAYYPAIGIFGCNLIAFYSSHQSGFNLTYTANQLRVGILGMLMIKLNKLSLYSIQKLNLGKVINLIGNDTNNIERASIVTLAVAPIVFVGGWGLLFYFWGVSSFVGIGYLILVAIVQRLMTQYSIPTRAKKSIDTDERIEKLEEVIGGIRTIKLQAWEYRINQMIKKIRTTEIADLKKVLYLDSIPRAFVHTSHWMSGFLIFLTYSFIEGPIVPMKIFPSLILLGHLRVVCMIQVFQVLTYRLEMMALSLRIVSIMDLPEVREQKEVPLPKNKENSIELENFTGYWITKNLDPPPKPTVPSRKAPKKAPKKTPPSSQPEGPPLELFYPAISDVNLEIKKGDFVAIIGKVASGKSSLLESFTGEMAHSQGELRYEGTYAYVGEESVIGGGLVKNIIISGKTFEESLFWEVIDACCLREDIHDLPEKEMTNIGESGVILSMEQKAKLLLAKALYLKADIYLLDEPFSWIDSRVSKRIFQRTILGFLAGKTILLVTFRLNFVKYADYVVIINGGLIQKKGTFQEVFQKKYDLKSALQLGGSDPIGLTKTLRDKISSYNVNFPNSETVPLEEVIKEQKTVIAMARHDEGLYLEDERLDDAHVYFITYYKYFKAMLSWYTILPMAVLFVVGEGTAYVFMLFVGKWGRGAWSEAKSMAIVGSVASASIIIQFMKFTLYFHLTTNAAEKLHNQMLVGILKSPLKFFDKNPLGRIVSRFSNDIGILDKFLIAALLELLEGFCLFMVYLITVWVAEPWLFIPAAVAIVFGVVITFWCRKAVKQTRAIELTTRAPLYSLFTFVVENLAIIRSRKQSDLIMKQLHCRMDDYSRANLGHMTSTRLMRFLIDYVTELTVIVTLCVFIVARDYPLTYGYFLNMVIQLPFLMQWILKSLFSFNILMSSAARIITYCENYKGIDLKKPFDETAEEKGWPTKGEIQVQNATVRYSEKSRPFITDLSLHIEAGEKVAIIGRSRAGMASIVGMLLRFFDFDSSSQNQQESFIKIDDFNIKDIGIHLLRKSFVVMPQEAFLFSGTLRKNLDPWEEHTDEEIWKALEDVGLKEFVKDLKFKLNTQLRKTSLVLSMGQKQLICFARSLLKKGKLVIQDEATSHLDIAYNIDIQNKVLEKYSDSTVITITHRVLAIAQYDKVLIMKNGRKIEFDEPYLLLVENVGDKEITRKDTTFSNLVLNLGPKLSKQIFLLTMQRYAMRHNINLDTPIKLEPKKSLQSYMLDWDEINVIDLHKARKNAKKEVVSTNDFNFDEEEKESLNAASSENLDQGVNPLNQYQSSIRDFNKFNSSESKKGLGSKD